MKLVIWTSFAKGFTLSENKIDRFDTKLRFCTKQKNIILRKNWKKSLKNTPVVLYVQFLFLGLCLFPKIKFLCSLAFLPMSSRCLLNQRRCKRKLFLLVKTAILIVVKHNYSYIIGWSEKYRKTLLHKQFS